MSDEHKISALALQLEEIQAFFRNSKGKNAADKPTDIDTVYSTFQAELGAHSAFLADQQLARSIATAVHTDGALVTALANQAIKSNEDRRVAL